jgi:hypothetical protein
MRIVRSRVCERTAKRTMRIGP